MNMKKIFKKEESIEVVKVLALTNDIKEHNRICNHVWKKYKSRV